jgi:hypothetical protein
VAYNYTINYSQKEKPMPESVTVNPELNIIEVWAYGAITSDDLVDMLKIIEKFHQERRINQLFVDIREANSLPITIKLYNFFSDLPRNLKIACFSFENSPLKRALHFVLNVAYNNNILLRVFTSQDEALTWLKSE